MGKIFLCYAHADNESSDPDKRWLDRAIKHMGPLSQQKILSSWSDQEIKAGTNWDQSIEEAISDCIAAVLFVSPDFLNSKYIRESEIPRLLKEAEDRGIVIIPVTLRHCLADVAEFKYPDPVNGPETFSLNLLQGINGPDRPLNSLEQHEQDKILTVLARRLLGIARSHP
jgi:hypothetical protein